MQERERREVMLLAVDGNVPEREASIGDKAQSEGGSSD